MFGGTKAFNADLSKWDTSKVTSMRGMFYNAESFNADLSGWGVSKVTNMSRMFGGAKAFDMSYTANWDLTHIEPKKSCRETDTKWQSPEAKKEQGADTKKTPGKDEL